MVFSQKMGNSTASRANYTIPGHIVKRCSNISKRHLFSYVYGSFIHNILQLDKTKMSVNQRMDKENMLYYTVDYYSAVINNDIIKFVGKRRELEKIILSQIIQTQKSVMICTPI